MSNIKKPTTLAAKIKQARKQVGLSQKDLGKILKLSDKAVSSYEVGRATPSVETLRELSKVTYKPLTYFLNDEDNEEDLIKAKIQLIEKELAEIKELLKKQK